MLSELPQEIVRHIGTDLSPEAALCFAHSCRHTYWAFDDWIVWRGIVKGSARVRTDPLPAGLEKNCTVDRVAMTETSTVRPADTLRDVTAVGQYVPQLMVLGCKHFKHCLVC